MPFNVRIFGYRGLSQIPSVLPKEFKSDSVQVMAEPYEFGQLLVSNGATPVGSAPDASTQTKVLRVEVPDGDAIRYEIGPTSTIRVPSANSPILQGINVFEFSPGWQFSFIDAANT